MYDALCYLRVTLTVALHVRCPVIFSCLNSAPKSKITTEYSAIKIAGSRDAKEYLACPWYGRTSTHTHTHNEFKGCYHFGHLKSRRWQDRVVMWHLAFELPVSPASQLNRELILYCRFSTLAAESTSPVHHKLSPAPKPSSSAYSALNHLVANIHHCHGPQNPEFADS
jgi:hypothetical protein